MYIRHEADLKFKNYGDTAIEKNSELEWADENGPNCRIDDPSWVARYEYERDLILEGLQIPDQNYKILELGSGPGKLCQLILEKRPHIIYDLVDKPTAKKIFQDRGYECDLFMTMDLYNGWETWEARFDYDLIIANDFLEHLANPSSIMDLARKITKDDAMFFISVPNWRMGHEFIYRGLFDYDNFLYFCLCHGWEPIGVYPSNLKCEYRPRTCYEEEMSDELITSWNWYFQCKKIK